MNFRIIYSMILSLLLGIVIGQVLRYGIKWATAESVPNIAPYVQSFEDAFGVGSSHIPIVFGDFSEDIVGECVTSIWGLLPFIKISKSWYRDSSPTMLEIIVWHELGHCQLDLNHDDREAPNGCPVSLMNSRVLDFPNIENCFKASREYYMLQMELAR